MKNYKYLITILFILHFTISNAQSDSTISVSKKYPARKLTIQPAIGLHPAFFSDVVLSNLIQWKVNRHLSFASHTSYDINDVSMRNFNYIKTNYNFSFNQKFGVGTTVYRQQTSHSFFLMGGVKYDAFKQTLNNPEFEKVAVSVSSLSPDYGVFYNLKAGKKKYFFSFSMYVPIYPYPTNGFDINSIQANMANFSLEMGIGIRLK